MSGARAAFGAKGLALSLFGLGAAEAIAVAGQAPAMTESLRTESITGGTRTQNMIAMYSLSDYLFQIGVGFTNADAFSFATIEPPDQLATPEVVVERSAHAAELLQQAVALDPGNAHKWFVLAQALAGAGQSDAAFRALERSQRLSPTILRLAYQRAWLYWALFETPDAATLSQGELASYRETYLADRQVAERLGEQQEALPPL